MRCAAALAIDAECLPARSSTGSGTAARSCSARSGRSATATGATRPSCYPQSGRPGTARELVHLSGADKFGRYLKRAGRFPGYLPAITSDDAQQIIADLLRVLSGRRRPAHRGGAPAAARRPRLPAPRRRAGLAARRRHARRGRSAAADLQRRGAAAGQPVLRPPLPGRRGNPGRADRPRAHRPGRPGHPREARGGLPRRRAEAAVLLADHGARRGHRRAERGLHAERAAHPGELRPALRPGRPVRPARPGHHLLRHRQQPRPVLLPPLRQDGRRRRHTASSRPAQRGPAPLPRPRDLARRGGPQARPRDPRVDRHGRHRAGRRAGPAPRCRSPTPSRRDIAAPDAARRATARASAVIAELADDLRTGPRGGTSTGWRRWCGTRPAAFDRPSTGGATCTGRALIEQWEQNRRRLDTACRSGRGPQAPPPPPEAETQLRLLRNEDADDRFLTADFNPYRYLASEGFLPGYSFPRLPLAAYIPAERGYARQGDYVQRPRFLAIREFGPRALIYHEGNRYEVHRVQIPPDVAGDDPATVASARRTAAPAAATTTSHARHRPVRAVRRAAGGGDHRAVAAAHRVHQAAAADLLRRGGTPPRRVPHRHRLPVPRPRRPVRPAGRDRRRRGRRPGGAAVLRRLGERAGDQPARPADQNESRTVLAGPGHRRG